MKWQVALVLLLVSGGCKDQGAEHAQAALQRYQQLVEQGVPATDARFLEVVALLDKVPSSSSARPKADALRRSLASAQAPKVRTPLAIQGGPHLASDVSDQLAKCRSLAEAFGTASEADRPARLRELDACRRAAEELDDAHVHSAAP